MHSKHLYFRLGLLNLVLVALFGFLMRLKIVFELPMIDYRNLLSAHSHFAFGGWVGFMLLSFFTVYLLPAENRRWFGYLLLLINGSALGMALTFPWEGYGAASLFFSSAFILLTTVYAIAFLRTSLRTIEKTTRMLIYWALLAMILSTVGPGLLAWMMSGASANPYLHRSAIYWFLHFQYNGFFTLGIFAHYRSSLAGAPAVSPWTGRFSRLLCAALLPSLFLSLLWLNRPFFYVLGAAGVLLLLAALYAFVRMWQQSGHLSSHRTLLGRRLLRLSFLSLGLKLLLQAGTIIPGLGNAVFGDRPVIIGFLHLVFLGFVSFYLLAHLAEEGYFTKTRGGSIPVYVFAAGIFANEGLLMLQGLGVLLGTNSSLFSWALLGAAGLLLSGALLMALSAWRRPTGA
ncbi:hypothetical protein [Flaviaesturariibacter aridisoli]|uniref:Cbb3-type cytochrome c oxidase subunit I n=1 Tax=Flaviaesturariibacter aridisoli TaxID=2545761 RepID=A0A4R4E6U1_9BACT|nr:hypothetical protein [Flaviaesturariibacter aridisoli]TCZ74777.1 hypothetical protein E0486_00290 [Flaviaesturariibacter aridisoli]